MDPPLLRHIAHNHPLWFVQHHSPANRGEEELPDLCGCCGQRVEGPSYRCNQESCEFLLHKRCAELELAPQITDPLHPQHPLIFRPTSPYTGVYCCDFCRRPISGFVYHCASCKFDLDVNCALFQPSSQSSTDGSSTSQSSSNMSRSSVPVMEKRVNFLSGLLVAFKEQIHTDIQLKPKDGPCIPAHKALLAARSEIFKNILDLDGCKAPPSDRDTITLSELNTEELESFLEFLYIGELPTDKLKKHVYSLYIAADKYEIPFLQESCEHYLLNSLNTSNALTTLEVSDAPSNKTLKETTLNFIAANMKDIVSTEKYEDFVSRCPNLTVQITRAFVDAKCK